PKPDRPGRRNLGLVAPVEPRALPCDPRQRGHGRAGCERAGRMGDIRPSAGGSSRMSDAVIVFGGAGFSGRRIAREWAQQGATVWATTRSAERARGLESVGLTPLLFDGSVSGEMEAALARATHIVVCAGPEAGSDPV